MCGGGRGGGRSGGCGGIVKGDTPLRVGARQRVHFVRRRLKRIDTLGACRSKGGRGFALIPT